MNTLRWKKICFEEIYHNGVTYQVAPRSILFVKIGDRHLVPITDTATGKLKDFSISTVIEIKELNWGNRIKITYQDKNREMFGFIVERDKVVHHFYKILRVNLASKEFWRDKK